MTPTNEFSRRLAIDPWPDHAVSVEVSAYPPERQVLAERFGLLAVRSLRARGRLERGSEPGELVLRGWLEADVVQACVISLEPLPARLRQRVERRYRSDRIQRQLVETPPAARHGGTGGRRGRGRAGDRRHD